MTEGLPAVVRVFGIPAAPGCPSDQTWEAVTRRVGALLAARFGPQVQAEYVDLFGPAMRRFPDIVALVAGGTVSPPVVTVNGTVVPAAGKVSVPAIRRALEALGINAPEDAGSGAAD